MKKEGKEWERGKSGGQTCSNILSPYCSFANKNKTLKELRKEIRFKWERRRVTENLPPTKN